MQFDAMTDRRGCGVDAFQSVTAEHCEDRVSLVHNQPPSSSAAAVIASGSVPTTFHQRPPFETLEFTSTAMSRWGLTSLKRYRPATWYCVNCAVPSSRPIPFSRRENSSRHRCRCNSKVSNGARESSPFPPLEAGSLNPARGSGAEPQPKSNLVHFSLEIWQLVATILMILLRINWPNFVQFSRSAVGLASYFWPDRSPKNRTVRSKTGHLATLDPTPVISAYSAYFIGFSGSPPIVWLFLWYCCDDVIIGE